VGVQTKVAAKLAWIDSMAPMERLTTAFIYYHRRRHRHHFIRQVK